MFFRWFSQRLCQVAILLATLTAGARTAAEPQAPTLMSWSLRDEFRFGSQPQNPIVDGEHQPTWHFLRTTTSVGPVESRKWLRDGKYVPLSEDGEKLFDAPLKGWAYRAGQRPAPAIGKVTAEYHVGLDLRPGDLLIAPGPEHAMVIGWRSPVAGILEIEGVFEHAQSCCGVNSQINWYVERGTAPDEKHGFQSISLATGRSDFGSLNQLGAFHIKDQPIQADEFIYFIVDAVADGTETPHHGDATRFDVILTVRDAKSPPPPSFEKDVLPILAKKCHDCHGADLQEAKLDLRTLSTMLQGGESGPAVVPGKPQESILLDLVARGQMPPEGEKLTGAEQTLLQRWIKAHTPAEEKIVALPLHSQVTEADRTFWAFQPPRKARVPQVQNGERVRTAIDAFLLAKLEEQGLTFSPEASRTTLIRRAYFDLIGLPPEPAAVQAFLEDFRPDAYERLVDSLLESPHYGERWGRHWLDAAGYVDGTLDNDLATPYPNKGIWRYRDYVIHAFNEDKPYDRFLIEQLAGDELVDWRRAATFSPETLTLLTATGFLRTVDDHTDAPQYGVEKRYEVIKEVLDMFSTSVLGLTMECCRCHNHKYDPLPQRDYYRLMACFEPAYNVQRWQPPKERFLADVSLPQRAAIDNRNAEIDQRIAELQQMENATREQARQRIFASRLASLPEPIRNDVNLALQVAVDQRSEVQKYLAAKFQATFNIADTEVEAALTEEERTALTSSERQRKELAGERKSYGMIQALWDVGSPPTSRVHRRGNVNAPGILVQPGFPEILSSPGQSSASVSLEVHGDSSGRRLALAQWLTRPDHPLTARVLVNRVWHHHFGRGIVETLGNFGRTGSLPTHPELLDWLAVDFVEHGWSIKRLHRQIMLSSAYRQSSRRPPSVANLDVAGSGGERLDPQNRLLWRMHLRRLESEIVRDAILSVSGAIDRAAGGPPIEITTPPDGLSEAKPEPTLTSPYRRSIYLFARRVYPLKFLEIFDAPIMPTNCTQRMHSATVLQSLALLNSEFLFDQADRMAGRVAAAAGADSAVQIELAFQLAFARKPNDFERQFTQAFLNDQIRTYQSADAPTDGAARSALADLCHMLMSANEFLYVE